MRVGALLVVWVMGPRLLRGHIRRIVLIMWLGIASRIELLVFVNLTYAIVVELARGVAVH